MVVALLLTTVVLISTKAPPLEAFKNIALGAVGSWAVFSDVLVSWVPLLLVTPGLILTFTVGLWNIGIEGQIILGAIFTTWAMRILQSSGLPPALILTASMLAGMAGGALWAMLARRFEDLWRRERDIRRPRAELCGNGAEPVADLRAVEKGRGRLHVGNHAVPPCPVAAHAERAVAPQPVGPHPGSCGHRGRVLPDPGNSFRPEIESRWEERERSLSPGRSNLAIHDGVVRPVRSLPGLAGAVQVTSVYNGSSPRYRADTDTWASWWRCS